MSHWFGHRGCRVRDRDTGSTADRVRVHKPIAHVMNLLQFTLLMMIQSERMGSDPVFSLLFEIREISLANSIDIVSYISGTSDLIPYRARKRSGLEIPEHAECTRVEGCWAFTE